MSQCGMLCLLSVLVLATTTPGEPPRLVQPPPPESPPPKPSDPKLIAAAPEKYLRETEARSSLYGVPGRVDEPLRQFLKKHPNDPLSLLLTSDRSVIGKLIPLVTDDTPVWKGQVAFSGREPPTVRVGDLALAVIDRHSQCLFGGGDWDGFVIRSVPSDTRAKLAKRIAEWWTANKDKPAAIGIRAAIPDADDQAKVVLAKRLHRTGDEDDKKFARKVLLDRFRRYPGNHTTAAPAFALAECGDLTPLDDLYELWNRYRNKPGHYLFEPKLIWYLCKHGRRREWNLLYDISMSEVEMKDWPGGRSQVWGSVMNSAGYDMNPFAIPFLALGLNQTSITGSRWVGNPGKAQPFSSADTAAGLLQQITGKDFGYKIDGSAEDRAAAIKKAQKWWEDEGKVKYTFDYIEKNLVKKAVPKKP